MKDRTRKSESEQESADKLNKKLDKIIEQSKLENDALKKLLKGLEKVQKDNSKDK